MLQGVLSALCNNNNNNNKTEKRLESFPHNGNNTPGCLFLAVGASGAIHRLTKLAENPTKARARPGNNKGLLEEISAYGIPSLHLQLKLPSWHL